MPGEEVEFEVAGAGLAPGELQRLGPLDQVVEVAAVPHGGRFDEDPAALVDGGQTAGADFSRLGRLTGAYWAVLGDMEKLTGPRPRGHHDLHGSAVLETDLAVGAVGDDGTPFADLGGQVFVGVDHLGVEDVGSFVFCLGDDDGGEVAVEEGHIEADQVDDGGEAELARLQYDIAVVEVFEEAALGGPEMELYAFAPLVYDGIQIVHSPHGIAEIPGEIVYLACHVLIAPSRIPATRSSTVFSTSTRSR